MTYEERLGLGYRHIIDGHAKSCIDKVVRKTILKLKKCKRDSNMMLSESDSGLNNLWDEICVQIQSEYSIFWDLYEDIIYSFTTKSLEDSCSQSEIQMIWLQTDSFDSWSNCEFEPEDELSACFDNNNFPVDYVIEDVVAHIVNEVLYVAGGYHNRRIENYLV